MNGKEISIKKAIEHIEVPEDRLDAIIEEAFFESSASKKGKRRNWLISAVAASFLVVGISAVTLISSPVLANYMSQLPVVGNVFAIFAEEEEGLLEYERFSEDVGLSQTSNGVTISIDQAVYDGTKVTFTYTVDSEEELDASAHLAGVPQLLEAEGSNSSMEWETVGTGLVGIAEITHPDESARQVNVRWEPESLNTESGEIKGDWKFEFAVAQLMNTDAINLDETVRNSGVAVHFSTITFTEISVNIAYQQLVEPSVLEHWEAVEAELLAQDNLGNVYPVPYNGGSTPGGARTQEDFEWTATVRGLSPAAETLTFYPFAHISKFSEKAGGDSKRIEFDAVEVNLIERTHAIIKDPVFPSLEEE